jgi:hypothetical protein
LQGWNVLQSQGSYDNIARLKWDIGILLQCQGGPRKDTDSNVDIGLELFKT